MKVKVMGRKFECRKDIHYKTQTGISCEKCNSKAFWLGIEPASSGLLDQCSTTELQKPLPTSELQRDWNDTCKPNFEAFVEADMQVIPSPP